MPPGLLLLYRLKLSVVLISISISSIINLKGAAMLLKHKLLIMGLHSLLVSKGFFINASLLLHYLRGIKTPQTIENKNFWFRHFEIPDNYNV